MIVRAIYHGTKLVPRVYRKGHIILQTGPVEFHVVEDGKLIVLGALNANSLPDGMYLDCVPEWVYPEQSGDVTTVEQVNSAKQTGDVLEVG